MTRQNDEKILMFKHYGSNLKHWVEEEAKDYFAFYFKLNNRRKFLYNFNDNTLKEFKQIYPVKFQHFMRRITNATSILCDRKNQLKVQNFLDNI